MIINKKLITILCLMATSCATNKDTKETFLQRTANKLEDLTTPKVKINPQQISEKAEKEINKVIHKSGPEVVPPLFLNNIPKDEDPYTYAPPLPKGEIYHNHQNDASTINNPV